VLLLLFRTVILWWMMPRSIYSVWIGDHQLVCHMCFQAAAFFDPVCWYCALMERKFYVGIILIKILLILYFNALCCYHLGSWFCVKYTWYDYGNLPTKGRTSVMYAIFYLFFTFTDVVQSSIPAKESALLGVEVTSLSLTLI